MESANPKIVFRYVGVEDVEDVEEGEESERPERSEPARLPKLALSQRMSLPLNMLIEYEHRSTSELRHFAEIEWVCDEGGE